MELGMHDTVCKWMLTVCYTCAFAVIQCYTVGKL